MFYEKKFLGKSMKYQKICFNFAGNSNKLPLKTQGYNFMMGDGLCSGLGLHEIAIPDAIPITFPANTTVIKAWSYKFFSYLAQEELHLLICYCSNNKLYRISLSSLDLYALDLTNIQLSSTPEMLAYRIGGFDRAIFYSKDDILFWTSAAPPYIPSVDYKIKSAAVFGNKILAALWEDEYKLHYCDIMSEPDFIITTAPDEDAGEIGIRKEFGPITRLLNFFDCLVVITEFGVLRLDLNENGKFVLTECFLSDAKIYADTAAVCGSKIFMLTTLGIYIFDGRRAKKSDVLEVPSYESLGQPVAAFFDGKYYLALKVHFDSNIVGDEAILGFVNNALIVINADTMHKDTMRGFDICSFATVVEDRFAKLFVGTRGSRSDIMGEFCADGTNFGMPLKKAFKLLRFGADSAEKKTIRSICIRGTLDCILTVKDEADKRNFCVVGGRINRFMVNMVSETFDIELTAQTSGKIDILEIEFANI
ncbi:MAG: hypothetical protein LBN07_02470 [Christensenellaceae bacterium]|jgi:hypothetical protein|nr:hypothetical protein [Christensenellaceae bacterium]